MTRLADALARLAVELPERGPLVIQHGWTPCPAGWEGQAMMPKPRLIELLRDADVVVVHGGPATIAEARALGKIPIVVPRLAAHGEHINDHQVAYSERLASRREVLLVEDVADLTAAVRDYESRVSGFPRATAHDPTGAIDIFAAAVDRMLAAR